ncbi:MAG: hypothetical protein COV91_05885 [Candidatus Taylorbacteria bacterium CG11_big_fil_rev_8_21_14_0_20_46_11]|uniref:Resolvase HTH domain-containing protein n=1 Tax=Candidatus Taylorbacteria bacterium CG11_big_fil_rev_8_21_14_0_20_46_11 TaxID=1975025 RepID=A0A2H0KA17_9BACT|nr:MAG: hypothetical protein COV91_05885 [Candidatus Taylorbacteria bacterium CG11_big_fil_rev_8_21_14_0_20_46_11]
MKIAKQQEARKLRAKGYSLSEIHRELKVSKSSASLWVQNVKLSPAAEKIILEKFTKGQLRSQEVLRQKQQNRLSRIKEEVSKDFLDFRDSRINQLVICALLYWCEGNKRIHDGISFTNSDPALIKTFVSLLRKVFSLNERKFRICMHLHPYHDEKKQKKFWSDITGIPPEQFTKPYLKPGNKKYQKEGYQGCIRVRYQDSTLTHKLFMTSALFMQKFGGTV